MNCLICQKNKADKTGSHIIPQFIIESMINDGAEGRNKEQSFRLGAFGSNFNFGSSVLPEKLEETLGRPINEEEIEESIAGSHYVIDNIFCTSCEKKLSVFESLYSEKIKPIIERKEELPDNLSMLLYTFWKSIILRISVVRFGNFSLPKELENNLREEINYILDFDSKSLVSKCNELQKEQKLLVLYYPNPIDSGRNFIMPNPNRSFPFVILCNEYTLIFDYKSESEKTDALRGFGLDKPFDSSDINYISDIDRELLIKYCVNISTSQLVDSCVEALKQLYIKTFGVKLPLMHEAFFKTELVNGGDFKYTDRYSEKRIVKLMIKYLGGTKSIE